MPSIEGPRQHTSPRRTKRRQGATRTDVPRYVRYADETPETYRVHDLISGARMEVAKGRAPVTPLLDLMAHPPAGARLLRWSAGALLGILLGGIGGPLLGIPVVLAALARRAALSRQMRQWRLDHPGEGLPTAARLEADRLSGALWQGVLAIALGLLIMGLFATHLW